MRRVVTVAFLLAMLSGCANTVPPSVTWARSNLPFAQQGVVPWSTYYKELYQRSRDDGAPGSYLMRLNGLIGRAEALEKGEISREQFESARRQATAEQRAESDANSERQRMATSAALMQLGQQMQQQQQLTYTPVQPAPLRTPVQTNCTRFGNQVNCTSY